MGPTYREKNEYDSGCTVAVVAVPSVSSEPMVSWKRYSVTAMVYEESGAMPRTPRKTNLPTSLILVNGTWILYVLPAVNIDPPARASTQAPSTRMEQVPVGHAS